MTNFYGLFSSPELRVKLKFLFAIVVFCSLATSVAVAQAVQRVSANDCVGGTNVFVFTGGSCTYGGFSWSVSAGGTILSGHGTRSVQVKWNSTTSNAYVSVSYYCTSNGAGGTSYSPTYTISNPVTPSVSLVSDLNNVCQGTNIRFDANPTNGGTNPTYSWRINGSTVISGTSKTFYRDNLNNGDVLDVVMTVSSGCVTQSSSTSNGITMNILQRQPLTVEILGPSTICGNESSVTFSAEVENGGNITSYAWFKNGSRVDFATDSEFTTSGIINSVQCEVYSNGSCVLGNYAISDVFPVTTQSPASPTVYVNYSDDYICEGGQITFTASTNSAYNLSNYRWKLNGTQVGTSSSFTTNQFTNGSTVSVTVDVSGTCVNTTRTADLYSDDVFVYALPDAAISLSGNSYIRSDSSVLITASPSGTLYSYQWFWDNAPINTPEGRQANYTASNTGAYKVEVTGPIDCKKMSPVLNIFRNIPPIANAGDDLTISLPVTGVALNGSGFDPDGYITAYSWTQVSGSLANLGHNESANLVVNNLEAGTYEFRLTVTDDFPESASDLVRVVVNEPPNNYNLIKEITVNEFGKKTEAEVDALSIGEKSVSIQYFDGLGRHIQVVNVQASPLKHDLVQPIVYDSLGREGVKYLPFVEAEQNGWYKVTLRSTTSCVAIIQRYD